MLGNIETIDKNLIGIIPESKIIIGFRIMKSPQVVRTDDRGRDSAYGGGSSQSTPEVENDIGEEVVDQHRLTEEEYKEREHVLPFPFPKRESMTQNVDGAIRNLRHENHNIVKIVTELSDNEFGPNSWGKACDGYVILTPTSMIVGGNGNGFPSVKRLVSSHQRSFQDERAKKPDHDGMGRFNEGFFAQSAIADLRETATTIDGQIYRTKFDVYSAIIHNDFRPSRPRLANTEEIGEFFPEEFLTGGGKRGTSVRLSNFMVSYNKDNTYNKLRNIYPYLYDTLGSSEFGSITLSSGERQEVFTKFEDFTRYDEVKDSRKAMGEIRVGINKPSCKHEVVYAELAYDGKSVKLFGNKPTPNAMEPLLGNSATKDVKECVIEFKYTSLSKNLIKDDGVSKGFKFRRSTRLLNLSESHGFECLNGMYRGTGIRGEFKFNASAELDMVLGVTSLKDIQTSSVSNYDTHLREVFKKVAGDANKMYEKMRKGDKDLATCKLKKLITPTENDTIEKLKERFELLDEICEKGYKYKDEDTDIVIDGKNKVIKTIKKNRKKLQYEIQSKINELGGGGASATSQDTLAAGGASATSQDTLAAGGASATSQDTLAVGGASATSQDTLVGGASATSQDTLAVGGASATSQDTLVGGASATSQDTLAAAAREDFLNAIENLKTALGTDDAREFYKECYSNLGGS